MDHRLAPRTSPSHALLVGTDEVLLFTRKAILARHGFHVSLAEPSDATKAMESNDIDVVVACHTLTGEEADNLVQAASRQPVRPALVSFSKEISPRPTRHPFDASVWSLALPEAFVQTVSQVLVSRQQ